MIKGNSIGSKASAFSANNTLSTQSFFYNQLSSELLNYQIIDAISASIYLKDTNGVYLDCNKYMLEIAALESRDQIRGKTDYDLPWREQAEKIRAIDQLVIGDNKTYRLEENPQSHAGIIRTFLSSKTPLIDNEGNIIGIIGVSIDITDSKKTEQLLELTEEYLEKSLTFKERFIRNIDHETRNPLQAMVGTAEILAEMWDKFSDKRRHETIVIIANGAGRLTNLVTNVFDLSRLLKKDSGLKLERADITELIESSVKSFNDLMPLSKSAHIVIKDPKSYFLFFDKQKIKQVIDNLLSNAIKWTEPNEVIMVELHKGFMPRSSISAVYCCITNKGIQIPFSELKLIFESFTESSNTASQACGIGLGLALCKEIIRAHRGKIWAENNSTVGVSFTFAIPLNLNGDDF